MLLDKLRGFVKIEFSVHITDSNSGRWLGGFRNGHSFFVNTMELVLMYLLIHYISLFVVHIVFSNSLDISFPSRVLLAPGESSSIKNGSSLEAGGDFPLGSGWGSLLPILQRALVDAAQARHINDGLLIFVLPTANDCTIVAKDDWYITCLSLRLQLHSVMLLMGIPHPVTKVRMNAKSNPIFATE